MEKLNEGALDFDVHGSLYYLDRIRVITTANTKPIVGKGCVSGDGGGGYVTVAWSNVPVALVCADAVVKDLQCLW